MTRKTKFEVGDIVIHSGSHYKGETKNNSEWGIVLECSDFQKDFGRWRSLFVHWFGYEEQNWISPRNLYLINDALEEIN